MPIIGTLPNNIQNGQTVDATPVMADFNFVVNQVNANANPVGTLTAPSGTKTLFYQPIAPVGWTIDATITDHTVQVVASGAGGPGGVNNYSSMFNAQWTTDGHALTTAELAAHNHGVTDPGHLHGVTDPGHFHVIPGENVTGGGSTTMNGASSPTTQNTNAATTGVSVNTATTGITTQNAGTGAAHSHTKTFNALFIQVSVGVKT